MTGVQTCALRSGRERERERKKQTKRSREKREREEEEREGGEEKGIEREDKRGVERERGGREEGITHVMLVEVLQSALPLRQNKFSAEELSVVSTAFP